MQFSNPSEQRDSQNQMDSTNPWLFIKNIWSHSRDRDVNISWNVLLSCLKWILLSVQQAYSTSFEAPFRYVYQSGHASLAAQETLLLSSLGIFVCTVYSSKGSWKLEHIWVNQLKCRIGYCCNVCEFLEPNKHETQPTANPCWKFELFINSFNDSASEDISSSFSFKFLPERG